MSLSWTPDEALEVEAALVELCRSDTKPDRSFNLPLSPFQIANEVSAFKGLYLVWNHPAAEGYPAGTMRIASRHARGHLILEPFAFYSLKSLSSGWRIRGKGPPVRLCKTCPRFLECTLDGVF